jgi:hypothetical protein
MSVPPSCVSPLVEITSKTPSLYLLQDEGRYLLGGVLFADRGDLIIGPHLSFDRRDGRFRVGDGLTAGRFADQQLTVLRERHVGRESLAADAGALGAGDDARSSALHDGCG